MTKVKICCIQSIKEAQIAIDAGAYAIGLVSEMPSGPGVISEKKIREIAEWAQDSIKTVLLTSLRNPQEIIEQYKKCKTNTLQLVDSQKLSTYKILKTEFPDAQIIQVIHVLDESSISESIMVSKYVDMLLLDSGNPNLEEKELGGTGRIHNWRISKEIVKEVNIPIFLAGGLTPDNVAEAIEKVQPFGVDLCTGIRMQGMLDDEKVKLFIEAVKNEEN